jgi:hypothetical protein
MTRTRFGSCVICGKIGQGTKDFICENCGGPDQLILACECGARHDLTKLAGGDLSQSLSKLVDWGGDEKSLRPGMTIHVSQCISCSGGTLKEHPPKIEIYALRYAN